MMVTMMHTTAVQTSKQQRQNDKHSMCVDIHAVSDSQLLAPPGELPAA